jgi:hypothetical protein
MNEIEQDIERIENNIEWFTRADEIISRGLNEEKE